MSASENETRDERARRLTDYSRFLGHWLDHNPDAYARLLNNGALDDPAVDPVAGAPEVGEGDFGAALRVYRDTTLAAIAWRDLAGVDALEASLAALSRLADRCIEAGLRYAESTLIERHGELRDEAGQPVRLIVIGMGKLGGGELNFSSDIDLIFSYAQSATSAGARALDADDYLKRAAQRLVKVLSESTAHGFVYRVDTRLRPFGDTGTLVASIDALENYYQAHGREWERYAWVKARPVAGDIEGGRRLIEKLRPFVYRRYLDYGTFESIRDMKALIDRQVVRAELQSNIKLGSGGIREIEFIVQAFQLIRGGQEPALQDNRLLPTLARLAENDHLPAHTADELDAAYRFLRRTENRLQIWADQQTHDLPEDAAQCKALAASMDYADWPDFDKAINSVRRGVHAAFEQVFASPQADAPETTQADQQLLALWEGELADDDAARVPADYGIGDARAARDQIAELQDQGLYRALQDRGRRWLMRLVPLLFAAAARTRDPDRAVVRTLSVLSATIGRSTYVALLVEHPAGLSTLMRLCAASAWITSQIRQQPALLDSLLDPRQLYRPPRRAELADTLDRELAALPEQDLERKMDVLRRFAQSATLRIAAADVSESMPLMIVSDNLTELAEVVLEAGLAMAWQQMTPRYGTPRTDDGEREHFCVIGYGKLGGLELGYSSDLDLVFVYDGPAEKMTDGERQLNHQAFFTRLAQRLIHILSTQTAAGRAYEVDMRLRPSGKSGLLVTHIDAFAAYQSDHAWTWEHQALVRARPVAGSSTLGERFTQVRETVLARHREPKALAREVQTMRKRMRANLDRSSGEQLDVKQMPGGLIDIEFMAQYAALCHGHDCPELLLFSDAIRILETLESAGIVDYDNTRTLVSAYRAYRRRIHEQALQQQRAMIASDELVDRREAVQRLWQRWIGQASA